MLYRKFYEQAYHKYLNEENINDYILRVLIMEVQGMKQDMSEFFLNDAELKDEKLLINYIERVIKGEPYQYVIQKARFLNNDFYVDSRVLIPRLETEEMTINLLNIVAKNCKNKQINILDVGTGSGCIAISLKQKMKNAKVFASDISQDALDVAKINCKKLHTNINFLYGNMLEPAITQKLKFDVVVSNPPYISNFKEVSESVLKYEPHLALFAKNGIDYYEIILKDIRKIINKTAFVAFEFNYDQKNKIEDLILKYLQNSEYTFYKDFASKWRYVIICIK